MVSILQIMASSSSSKKRANEQNVQGLLGYAKVQKQGPKDPSKASRLAKALLHKYFWGEVSASTVQSLAMAAVDDGLDDPMVVTLSRLGSQGVYSGWLVEIHKEKGSVALGWCLVTYFSQILEWLDGHF